jgi:predicted MFS family arabinose efflux permease
LLQYGWRAPFVLSGVIGVVTALVIYITVPNVTIADEVVSKSSTSNIVKHSVDENGVLAKLKVLLSIPLCCLFVGSMCSFFMQRGLADWAGSAMIFVVLRNVCGWLTI